MSWDLDMVRIVRYLIDDVSDTPRYSDSRLAECIVIAAQMCETEVSFDNDYTINIASTSITPDPVSLNDNGFINLVSLKSACIVYKGEHRASSDTVAVFRDGSTILDNTESVKQKKTLYEDLRKQYEESKLQYIAGNRTVCRLIANSLSHPDVDLGYLDEGPRFY